MNTSGITNAAVHDVLRATVYAQSLARSPLLDLDAVTARLRADGLADTPKVRQWVLGRLLRETTLREMARRCGDGAQLEAPGISLDDELAALRRLIESGDRDAGALGLVYCRYLAEHPRQRQEVALRSGMSVRTAARRLQHGYDLLAAALLRVEEEAVATPAATTAVPIHERVVVDQAAPHRNGHEARAELLATVRDDVRALRLAPRQIDEILRLPVADLVEYRLGRIAEWSRPRYRLDERFVNLSLLVDPGEESDGSRWSEPVARFGGLRQVLEQVPDPALVVLGPPGCGKSTLLRHFELQTAVEAMRTGEGLLTFFVQLSRFRPRLGDDGAPDPGAWLNAEWATRYPRLPPLVELLATGRMVLLLDALTRMPHRDADDYRRRLLLWKSWLRDLVATGAGNRVVFSCRWLDYSAPLSTPTLRVPQVRIEPLTDQKVQEFLVRYDPARADALWSQLKDTPQLEAFRSPFFLKLLVGPSQLTATVPSGRAALFTACARGALRRELERDNRLFVSGELLTDRDRRRIIHARQWCSPYDLPEGGPLIGRLTELAYRMQSTHTSTEATQVRFSYAEALTALDHEYGADILAAAEQLGALDEDLDRDELMFTHQLTQEYFAGRWLARHPEPGLVRAPWRATDVRPGVAELVLDLATYEPLPSLPTTGWEETMRLAAAMAPQPEAFVRALAATNLSLAGACAAQPETLPRLGVAMLDDLRQALLARSRDLSADLRHRIDCGLALGRLGDPRFDRRQGPGGEYLLPPLVAIQGGRYVVGEDGPLVKEEGREWDDHCPAHPVDLAPFHVGRFHVTNAEWACFIAASGYEDEQWWDTAAAREWRAGLATADGLGTGWDADVCGLWRERLQMTEDEFAAHLGGRHPDRRVTEPRFWRNEHYNNPLQPVIGITWFESRAYCRWLAAQSGLPFRLLTEVEREAAARGPSARLYPYGDTYAPLLSCGVDAHVGRTAPVGVFPASDSPEGVSDLAGNTKTWTSTAWGPSPDYPAYRYPYVPDDGREDLDTPPTIRRIVRGVSYGGIPVRARATCRGRSLPGIRARYTGLRLACG